MDRHYRAAKTDDPVFDGRLSTVKTASPGQLASIIEGITGYRWSFGGRDGLTTDVRGLPVLGGGIDSRFVTTPSHTPSVGAVFIQERLAQAAGWAVASNDLSTSRRGDAILLRYISARDTPETAPERFAVQIRYLYARITGMPLPQETPEIEQLNTLWKQLYSVDASPVSAWAGIVSVILRDPQVLFY